MFKNFTCKGEAFPEEYAESHLFDLVLGEQSYKLF